MSNVLLQSIRPLTQDERLQAMQNARDAVRASYGNAPQRAAFEARLESMTWVDMLIWALCIVVLAAAFVLSAMRLYHIGRETFMHSIAHEQSAMFAGAFIVILAEATQLISALALAKVHDRKFRIALYLVGAGATCIAIVGNVQVVQPWAMDGAFGAWVTALHNPFAWLEAFLPPLFVLAMAHVLKHELLDAVALQVAQKSAYEKALAEWQRLVGADAETHAEWTRFYANALRDAVRAANARTKAGKETLPLLTNADWRALVYREMHADRWYENAAQTEALVAVALPPTTVHVPQQSAKRSRTGNGGGGNATDEVTTAMQNAVHFADGSVQVQCPYCNEQYVKPDAAKARLALTAHVGRWCKIKNTPAPVTMPASDAARQPVFSTNGHSEEAQI